MLSKNNKRLQAEKMEPKHQRFAIKKFTVGVASVLIGTTFAINMGTKVVSADETTAQTTEVVGDSLAETSSEKNEATSEETSVATASENEVVAPEVTAQETQAKKEETSDAKQTQSPEETNSNESATETKISDQDQNKTETSTAPQATETASAFRSASETTVAPTTAETTAPEETATSETKNPQWPAAADAAVTNDNGIYTPQISYNRKFWTFQANPGMITDEVAKSNTIPFSMAEQRTGGTVVTSKDYKIRLQLDNRLVDSVSEVSLTQRDDTNKTIYFTRVLDDAGNKTNIWEATLLDIFNEPVVGYAYLAENGRIVLNDTVENVLNKISDVEQNPLLYNAYVYDASSRTALLATNNEGYIVGPNDPLSEKQVTPTYSENKNDTKFIGSHNVISYDKTIGENGALVVFYQASKKGSWTDGTGLVFNYGIDPALLPYLEKTGDAYTVELNKVKNDDQYGFVQDKTNKLWIPLNSTDTTKVADLTLDANGTGSYAPADINDKIQFGGFASGARPVALLLVYRLNQRPDEIYASLKKDGKAGGSLLFNNYFTDTNGVVQNYSMASNLIAFDDSDGDGIPDLKEEADLTNPLVSMPNISNVYVSENKVHGELVFNQAEGTKQEVTVTDEKGTVYGSTTVTPERFDGVAKAQKFDIPLTKTLPAAGTKLIVSVSTIASSGDSMSNNLPQKNEVTLKEGAIAKTDLKYYTGVTVGDDAKNAIANTANFPENATYAWVTKPNTTQAQTTSGQVKVTFPDELDPTYTHELLVTVPATVTDIDLTKSTIEVNKPTLHVNQDIDTVNDMLTRDYVENELIKKLTLANGTVFEGQELKDVLNALVAEYSWSDDPDTTTAGKDIDARLRAKLNNKRTVSWNMKIDVVGAQAKADLQTPWGTELEASKVIANTDELERFDTADKKVSYAWKEKPNFEPGVSVDHHVPGVVVVTYPDGTTQDVPVTITVGDSQADAFAAKEATTQKITVHYGQTVNPNAGLVDPTGNNVKSSAFVTPVDTTVASNSEHPATVTFTDGSTAPVDILVEVIVATPKSDATTPWGKVPEAKSLIANTNALAQFDQSDKPVSYAWKQQPNVKPEVGATDRNATGIVTVTYPDGTTQDVEVNVLVDKSDADTYTPNGQEVKTPVGGTPDATAGIANLGELPAGTTATWKEPVDTKTPGHKEGTVVVTYPDGTTEEVTVPVKVGTDAQINEPTAQEVKTPVGGTPEATTGIANLDELPAGTTVAWKEPVDTTTPGHKEGTVVVTYPDGTTEEVTVPVKVGTDAQINEPTAQEVKTPVGGTPEATTGIANLDELPKGTTVTWKEPVDTKTPGHKEGTVVVTYPDGTTEEVTVPVKVGTDAQINEPVVVPITSEIGKLPTPEEFISNLNELPTGTVVTWNGEPNVSKAGNVKVSLLVTYPDGSSEVLEAELIIVGETKEMVQRPQTKPNVAATTDEQVKPMSTTNEPANAENKPDELPQTGDIDGQKASALGMLSMLAGLFGIGVAKRKKRDEE